MKDIHLNSFVDKIKTNLVNQEWVILHEYFGSEHTDYDFGCYKSYLINDEDLDPEMKSCGWNIAREYKKIVSLREFHNNSCVNYLEISEDFKLFFNLYEKIEDNGIKIFLHYNFDNSEGEEVVKIDKMECKIKLKYLIEYLANKKLNLVICFDMHNCFIESVKDLGIKQTNKTFKSKNNYIFNLCIQDCPRGDDKKSISRICGKKILKYKNNFKKEKEYKYEKFIIGVDKNGKNIEKSCDTSYETDFLKLVFFSKSVLKKYYDNTKCEVKDGYLDGNGFGLNMNNNNKDSISVYLGDLKSLPNNEQKHFKLYNISPSDNKMSHVDYCRNILGEFSDPENPEFYFKQKLEKFNIKFNNKFNFRLFLEPVKDDEHIIKSLHIPTENNIKEFEENIILLTKVLIDSINEKEIKKHIIIPKKVNGSILFLEKFLESKGYKSSQMFEFIRNLQNLRSKTSAHPKPKDIKKKNFYDYFKLDKHDYSNSNFIDIYSQILWDCIWTLNTIENKLLK